MYLRPFFNDLDFFPFLKCSHSFGIVLNEEQILNPHNDMADMALGHTYTQH